MLKPLQSTIFFTWLAVILAGGYGVNGSTPQSSQSDGDLSKICQTLSYIILVYTVTCFEKIFKGKG